MNQTDVITPEQIENLLERPVKWTTQLRDLGDPDYFLTEPIQIVIEEFLDDSVIARFPEVGAFGEGYSEAESLQNLKNAILDLYDELISANPDTLGDEPKMWLRVLNRLSVREETR